MRTPNQPRVLVIDDEAALRRTYTRILGKTCDVVDIGGGRAAVEAVLEDDDFDVVILDLRMPDMAGSEVYRAFQDIAPELVERIVFATGGPHDPFLREVPNLQVPKPMSVQDLRGVVDRVYKTLGPRYATS